MTDERVAEAALVAERAAAEWSRGDVIRALAAAEQLDQDRYQVRGLDEDGDPIRTGERIAGRFIDAMVDDSPGGGYPAVRGGDPRCAAVGLYRGAGFDHAWLVITTHRVAVLRLRDTQDGTEDAKRELLGGAKDSLGGALRGLGKFVKTSAAEFAKSMRRPPLHERPADALLECTFELPLHVLQGVQAWRQPLVPDMRGGPRFVQVFFTDGSWARLRTDERGQAALLGPG